MGFNENYFKFNNTQKQSFAIRHLFINDPNRQVVLCPEGKAIGSDIKLEVDTNNFKWKITIETSIYICGGMGSCGLDRSFESLSSIFRGQGYDKCSSTLKKIFSEYKLERHIIEDFIIDSSLLDSLLLPTTFWNELKNIKSIPKSLILISYIENAKKYINETFGI